MKYSPSKIARIITLCICTLSHYTISQNTLPESLTMRSSVYTVNPLFLNRISARQMTGEPISRQTMLTLLEAAHWAPSSYNEQPWFFAYAMRGTKSWDTLLDCLAPGNKQWAQDSAVLGIMFTKKNYTRNNKPNPSALFDIGAAFENMALQGSLLGLTVIALGGLDWKKLYTIASHIASTEKLSWTIDLTDEKENTSELIKKYAIAGIFVVGIPQPQQEKISQRKPLASTYIELE